jgi:hypothetical protein
VVVRVDEVRDLRHRSSLILLGSVRPHARRRPARPGDHRRDPAHLGQPGRQVADPAQVVEVPNCAAIPRVTGR